MHWYHRDVWPGRETRGSAKAFGPGGGADSWEGPVTHERTPAPLLNLVLT